VIAQALTAAYQTVAGRPCHSLQAYFIRPGDPKESVLYEVEETRDGRPSPPAGLSRANMARKYSPWRRLSMPKSRA